MYGLKAVPFKKVSSHDDSKALPTLPCLQHELLTQVKARALKANCEA
jgi:hypothetical protein